LPLFFAACSEAMNDTGQISKRIGEVTHNPEAREVDVSKLTTFGWDRFYVFKPGTPRDEICRFIGATRANCGRVVRYLAVPESHMALVFGLGSQLTHTELHARANGQFDVPPSEVGYKKEAAVFKIRRSQSASGNEEVWLEQK
jgi:hypothetical protein